MNVTEKYFRYSKINENRLTPFGFTAENGAFTLERPIADGQMKVCVEVISGEVYARVFDCATGDEYTLHTVDGAEGEFVGKVRSQFEELLQSVASACGERCIFKEVQSGEIIEYIRTKYGDELEFPWDELDAAIWRRRDSGKWYGLIMIIKREKLGLGEGFCEVMNLHALPETIDKLADGERYFRGYHMNKKHWLTVCLDGRLPTADICALIDTSFELAARKKR